MIYFIAAWCIVSIVSWLIGTALIISLRADCFDRMGDRIIVSLWLGLVLLADSLLLLSLILPLSPIVGLAFAIGISLLLICWAPIRDELQHLWRIKSLAVVVAIASWAVLVAAYMTTQVTWFDTGLYHFGLTRWLSEFGTVPGLALVLNNLGFTSSWFALTAPLSIESVASRVHAVTNGWVALLATCHGFLTLWYWVTGKARVTDKFMLIFLVLVLPGLTVTPFLSAIVTSSSPDVPIIFLTGVVAWSILTTTNSPSSRSEQSRTHLWGASLIPLLLAVGAVSIKLSALPLLPIALLFYGQQPFLDYRRLLFGGLLSLLLLSPLMIVSIVTSGCPLYPSSVLCVNVPWRVSAAVAHRAVEVIRFWDHNFGEVPPGANRFFWQLWEWLKFARFNAIMLLLLLLSMGFAIPTLRSARKQKIDSTSWLLCCSLIGMVFIMLRAPMIRFGLGYFMMTPAITISILGTAYFAKSNWQFPRYFSGPNVRGYLSKSFFVGLGLIAVLILFQPDIQARLFLPPAMPSTAVESKQSYDVQYVQPVNDSVKCWDAPIPCTHNELNIRLRHPSRGLRAGFVPAETAY
ncbi:LIC_10190 family membrane protein [Leptolyngbya sp. Heron Island J]|uniref:LIC_10190 family membrane protein n=1 Tax=Leptolyngbya sp. Heron Island J TaxID=1385935 RepID=UPI001267959E|nr:hypothetical protein [Leptolyngbya sp. Heron Island J]